jgi:membrane associated rhomboid family serine protease
VGPTSSSLLGHEYYGSIDNQIRSDNTQSDTLLSLASIHGMYAPIPHKKKKGDAALDRRPFRQKYSSGANLTRRTRGWPSLTQAVMMISAPSSTLSKYSYIAEEQSTVLTSQHEITFVESGGTKKWCLQSGGEQWCSNPMMANASKDIIYQYPTSGTWYHSSIETRPPISISCPTPSTSTPTQKKSRHHQKQTGKQNQNLKFLLHHPSTTLLLLLNITLAYQYWNHRIPPSTVSKSYNKICIQHEWWRAFTGATAHFEPLHIGFNMMSLHTLGKELEGGFGSIVFLVYNVALVVMCTAVMMGMVYGRLCWVRYFYRGSEDVERRLIETSSVGYSGVLFALMVM